MASNSNLTVTISAVDLTSKAIDAVAKKLGGITAPARQVTGSLARLSDASGITRLSKAVVQLGGSAAGTGLRLVNALGPLSGLTAALSLGGLAKMTTDWARFSQSLGFDAARIGSSVGDLHALEGSARLSGSSAEAAANGLRTLQDTMTDTTGGRNMEALVYFRQLGVAFDDGRGHALRATAVLPKLADAIGKIKDPSLQARVATVFFGGAAESMLPWLRRGSAGMAEYAEMARHYGVQTEASSDKAGVFRLAQTRLSLAFEGLGNSISEKVSPPLAKMMTFLAELVNKWRKPISDTLGGWAKAAGEWVAAINWPGVIKNIENMATKFKSLMDMIRDYNPPEWLKWVLHRFASADASADDGGQPDSEGHIAMPRPAGVEADTAPLTPRQHTERGRLMMGMFEDRKWTHDDAAAILAGLDRESGLRVDAKGDQDKKTGVYLAYGAAQWHPDRQAQFDAWSKNGGTDDGHDIRHSSIEEQTRFIEWDLTKGKYKYVGDHMKAAKTLEDKVNIFDREYEGPKDPDRAVAIDVPRARYWAGQPPMADSVQKEVPREKTAPEPIAVPPARPWAALTPTPGRVQVDVHFKGLPPGASAVATTTGDVRAGVRVARAMMS